MLISVLIAIFASAGSVVAFLVLGNKTSTKPDVTELISPVEEEKDSIGIFQDTTVSEVKEVSMLSEKDKKTEAAMARQPEKVTPVVVDEPRKQPDTKQVPAEGNKITIQPVQPTAEEIEAKSFWQGEDGKSGLYECKERFHESERNQVDGRGRTPFDFL